MSHAICCERGLLHVKKWMKSALSGRIQEFKSLAWPYFVNLEDHSSDSGLKAQI